MGRIKDLQQYGGSLQRPDVWFMADGDSFPRGLKMSAQQVYNLCKGADGKNILIQNTGAYIQWQYQGDSSWTNLVALTTLKGADGRQLEIQVASGYIQTRLTGGAWSNLAAIASLKGDKGDDAASPAFSFGITALAHDATPTASVTGTYPNLIVSLGIPKGQDAASPNFAVSSESKAPGTDPEVIQSGSYPNILLNFKIPQGLQGATGKPLVVLPNGNYGNWDNGLGQYVDSGVYASATLILETTPVQFVEAEIRANIQSGEGVTSLFGKIKKWFADLGALAFKNSVDYGEDIDNLPALADVATSGDYGDLANTPTLADVATSGDYGDLANTPTLAEVATSGDYDDLANSPTLAEVATSGDYDDLANKPAIPEIPFGIVIDANYVHTDSNYTAVEKTKLGSLARPKHKSASLDISTWEEDEGLWSYTISDEDILSDSFVEIVPESGSLEVFQMAEFYPKGETGAGEITIYAKNQATAEIDITYVIL